MVLSAYLDYNATAPMRPEVLRAVTSAMAWCGNPSSVHRSGRLARRMVEEARCRIADLVGAEPDQVIFTSGGTEANNLALRGVEAESVLVSAVEHDSVLKPVADAEIIPVGRDGIVDLDALRALLNKVKKPALVSVMLANNETGVISPIRDVVEVARAFAAVVHCDAVQGAGKIAVDMVGLGVDMLSLSAHKLGGPQGIGALVLGDAIRLKPMLLGGGQERGRRAGTENVPAIAGFGMAAKLAGSELASFAGEGVRLAGLRDALEARVRGLVPETEIFGLSVARLPNTSCFTMPGVRGETQVMALDLAGVAVSAGAACSSGKIEPSRVLQAMGVDDEKAGCSIRVSLGWQSGEEEVELFLEAWGRLHARKASRDAAAA